MCKSIGAPGEGRIGVGMQTSNDVLDEGSELRNV